jgi:hypothetical protein
VRGHAGEPEHVLVIGTLGAAQRRWLRGRRANPAYPEAAPVATSRVTLVGARPFDGAAAAEQWLRAAGEDDVARAFEVVNRVLHLQRVASADPHVREVGRDQALVARIGFGDGERVAEGRWVRALELPAPRTRPKREAALRPQERLAALLGGRDAALACEELVVRARQDVDGGRRREAAMQLAVALDAALAELEPWSSRGDLAARLAELRELQPAVAAAARAALEGGVDDAAQASVRRALERLEAALRARTALGFD